jgi:uncharacterized protein YycO
MINLTHQAHNEQILELVKPGDVLLSLNKKSIYSKIIVEITHTEKSHALIYLGAGKVLESSFRGGGVEINHISKYLNQTYAVTLHRHKTATDKELSAVLEYIRSKVGYKYGTIQILWDGLLYLLGLYRYKMLWLDVDSGYTCSELIAEGFQKGGGFDLIGHNEEAVVIPQFFDRSDDFMRIL